MDRSTPITLISETWAPDEYGVNQPTEAEHPAYANVRSVTRAEFFEGGRNGLNPELEFTVFFGDYSGERIVEYNGIRYTVYRTYQGRNDTIELYTERREGNG
ncbi:MAG TPA: hypothetical protein DCF49_00200 [Lachnospiraceae bacterium]|nr:hypothetical protein [Lachnospiraceae bacterium]